MNQERESYSCPNCRTLLSNEAQYCHQCGQKRIHPEDYSVWHLIVESVWDFFHFESKFLKTLIPLCFRPGSLTVDYLQGKRARYFQPFKLFLFISFLYFVTYGLISHTKEDRQKRINVVNKEDTASLKSSDTSYNLSLENEFEEVLSMPDDSLRKQVNTYGLNRFIDLKYPRESWFARFFIKQVVKDRIHGSKTFAENMHKTIPRIVFILIPFIAMLLKLLYIRRKIPYFNHIIFSLHFLSFVFLIFWFNLFLSLLAGWIDNVIFLLILAYLFIAMLKFYRQRILRTLGKFLLLFFGILVILGIFYIIAATVSFMMI
jgi:hypothetical protein